MKEHLTFILLCFLLFPKIVIAQNLGGIPGPIVNEKHKSMQYRVSHSPEDSKTSHRIHYQQSINDDVMLRLISQFRESDKSNFDIDGLKGEVFWELENKSLPWNQGLRFDLTLRSDNRPASFGFNYLTEKKLNKNFNLRAVALTSFDFGENANNGIFLQTRLSVAYKNKDIPKIGIELFNNYGSTSNMQSFSEQSHQIGPFVLFEAQKDVKIYLGSLFGISNNADDTNLRLMITKSF